MQLTLTHCAQRYTWERHSNVDSQLLDRARWNETEETESCYWRTTNQHHLE